MKKIPMRSCVITKEKLPKKELIRVVRTPDGEVIIDVSGKANGRGAYLKKDIEVIKKAKNNFGGEGGVRTLAPLLRPNSLANCPLHHLGTSPYINKKMAEEVGFEPTVPFDITSFQDWLLKPLGHLSEYG